MGFCFNRQLHMLHSVKDNKRRCLRRRGLIRDPVISRKTAQLSAEDYSFLKSIGLKIKVRKNDGRQ